MPVDEALMRHCERTGKGELARAINAECAAILAREVSENAAKYPDAHDTKPPAA